MRLQWSRCFHIFVIFCHLNLIITSSWAGHSTLSIELYKQELAGPRGQHPYQRISLRILEKHHDDQGYFIGTQKLIDSPLLPTADRLMPIPAIYKNEIDLIKTSAHDINGMMLKVKREAYKLSLQFSPQGHITLNSLIAEDPVEIVTFGNFRTTASHYKARSLAVHANSIHNYGHLTIKEYLRLQPKREAKDGIINRPEGRIECSGHLDIVDHNFINQGKFITPGNLTVNLHNNNWFNQLTHEGETLIQANNGVLKFINGNRINNAATLEARSLKIQTRKFITTAKIKASNKVVINVDDYAYLKNYIKTGQFKARGGRFRNKGIIEAQLTRWHNHRLINMAQGTITAAVHLGTLGTFINHGLIKALHSLSLNTQGQAINFGKIISQGSLMIQAKEDLHNAHFIQAQQKLVLKSTTQITNSGTFSSHQGSLTFLQGTGNLVNSGTISAHGLIEGALDQRFDNRGTISSQDHLNLRASTVDNHGDLIVKGIFTIAANNFTNHNSGTVISKSLPHQGLQASLQAQQFINRGDIQVADTLTIAADTGQQYGNITAVSLLTLLFKSKLTQNGKLNSQSRLVIHSNELSNEGIIDATHLLKIDSHDFSNSEQGLLNSHHTQLDSDHVDNMGKIVSSHLHIHSDQFINHQSGSLVSYDKYLKKDRVNNSGNFVIKSTKLENQGTINATQTLKIASQVFTNYEQGSLYSHNTQLVINRFDNKGKLKSHHLQVDSDQFTNHKSGLVVGHKANLSINDFTNRGSVESQDLVLKVNKGMISGKLTTTEQQSWHVSQQLILAIQSHIKASSLGIQGQGTVKNYLFRQALNITQDLNFKDFTGTFLNNGEVIIPGKICSSYSDKIIGRLQLNNKGIMQTTQGYDLITSRLENSPQAEINGSGTIETTLGQNTGIMGDQNLNVIVREKLSDEDPTQEFKNTGTITFKSLKGSGVFHNLGLINNANVLETHIGIKTFNNGTYKGTPFSGQVNAQKILMTDDVKSWNNWYGIFKVIDWECEQAGDNKAFANYGEINTGNFRILKGNFHNQGLINFGTLVGQGHLLNQGTLQATGTIETPSIIGLQSLDNQAVEGTAHSGTIRGEAVTFDQNFIKGQNDKGSIRITNLVFSTTLAPWVFINQGQSLHKNLTLHGGRYENQQRVQTDQLTTSSSTDDTDNTLINSGEWLVKDTADLNGYSLINSGTLSTSGQIHGSQQEITNTGYWIAKEAVKLPQTILVNQAGELQLQKSATFYELNNQANLVSVEEFTVQNFTNQEQGQIDIEKKLNVGSSFSNKGILSVEEGQFSYPHAELINDGTLILKDVVFTQGVCKIVNNKDLRISGQSQGLRQIINHDNLQFTSGRYTFETLHNYKILTLFGAHWLIANTTHLPNPESQTSQLIINNLINEDTIQVKHESDDQTKGSLSYEHPIVSGTLIADQELSINLEGRSLTPSDITAWHGGEKLILKARDFTIDQSTSLATPYLVLYLTSDLRIKGGLNIGALEAYVQGDLIGGTDNRHFSWLQTRQGILKIVARGIDARYMKIFGKGLTHLQATYNKLLLGAIKTISDCYPYNSYCGNSFNPQYDKPIRNGAYAASGSDLILKTDTNDIVMDYGETFSQGHTVIQTPLSKQFKTASGRVLSHGNITFNIGHLHATRPGQMYRSGSANNENYPAIQYYLEYGDPATVQALQSIFLNLRTAEIDCGDILAGQNISINDIVVADNQKKFTQPTFFKTSPNRQNWKQACNKGHGWESRQYFGKAYTSNVMAAQKIEINKDIVETGATMNAETIGIKAKEAQFINQSRVRESANTHSRIIDIVDYANKNFTGGFFKEAADGDIVFDVPMIDNDDDEQPAHNEIVLLSEQTPKEYQTAKILIKPVVIEYILQHILMTHAGTLRINSFDQAITTVKRGFAAAHRYRQRKGMNLWLLQDIHNLQEHIIAYKYIKDEENAPVLVPHFVLAEDLINNYNQPGDISSGQSTIKTEGLQVHANNRVVTDRGINLIKAGKLEQRTDKFTTHYVDDEGEHSVEHAYPQQGFYAFSKDKDNDVVIIVKGDIDQTGVDIRADRDIVQESLEGSIRERELTLTHTTTNTKKSSNGFSDKITTTRNITPTFLPGSKRAGRNIIRKTKAQQSTILSAIQDDAEKTWSYEGGDLSILTAKAMQESSASSSTSSAWSHNTVDQSQRRTTMLTPSIRGGQELIVNAPKADLEGAELVTEHLYDNTTNGMTIRPAVGLQQSTVTATTNGALGAARQYQDQGQEFMHPSHLLQVQNIHVKNKIKPLELISVVWDSDKTKIYGAFQTSQQHLNSWNNSENSASGLCDPNVSAVVSLAVAIGIGYLTMGTGSAMAIKGIGMTKGLIATEMMVAGLEAGLAHLGAQAVLSLAHNGGNVAKTGQDLVTEDSVKSLAITAVAAGALTGINTTLNIQANPTELADQLEKQAIKNGVGMAANLARGQDLPDALRGAVFNTVAGVAANQIGLARTDGAIDNVTHKVLHAILGGALGATLSKDKWQGALAGATGAVMAEIITDAVMDDVKTIKDKIDRDAEAQGRTLTDKQRDEAYWLEVQKKADWGRMTAAVTALATGQDVNIAVATATNAVDNNFKQESVRAFMNDGLNEEQATILAEDFEDAMKHDPRIHAAAQGMAIASKELADIIKAGVTNTPASKRYEVYKVINDGYQAYQQFAKENPKFEKNLAKTLYYGGQLVRVALYASAAAMGGPVGVAGTYAGEQALMAAVDTIILPLVNHGLTFVAEDARQQAITIEQGEQFAQAVQGTAKAIGTVGAVIAGGKALKTMGQGVLGTTLNQAPTVFKRITSTPKPIDPHAVSSNPALATFITNARQSILGSSPKTTTTTTAAARITTSTTTSKTLTTPHSKVVTTNVTTNVTKIGATSQPKFGPRVHPQTQVNVEQQVNQFVRKQLIEQPKPRVAQPTANALLITNANKQITAQSTATLKTTTATTSKVMATPKAPVNKVIPATGQSVTQPKINVKQEGNTKTSTNSSIKNSNNKNKNILNNPINHNHSYHPRIRQGALKDPVAHNFPYTFDKEILNVKPIKQSDGSLLYRKNGNLNGVEGFYEIGLNTETNTIFHRTFVRKGK